jgi:hypothetical protein
VNLLFLMVICRLVVMILESSARKGGVDRYDFLFQ